MSDVVDISDGFGRQLAETAQKVLKESKEGFTGPLTPESNFTQPRLLVQLSEFSTGPDGAYRATEVLTQSTIETTTPRFTNAPTPLTFDPGMSASNTNVSDAVYELNETTGLEGKTVEIFPVFDETGEGRWLFAYTRQTEVDVVSGPPVAIGDETEEGDIHIDKDTCDAYVYAGDNKYILIGDSTTDPIITVCSEKIPDAVGTLAQWLKAEDLALTDLDPVGSWTSAIGVTPTQSTSGEKPLWRDGASGIGGIPAIQFDGIDDNLKTTAAKSIFTGTKNDYTLIMVLDIDDAGIGTIYGLAKQQSSPAPSLVHAASIATAAYQRRNDTELVDTVITQGASGAPIALSFKYDAATTTISIKDHTLAVTSAVSAADTLTLLFATIGANENDAGVFAHWEGKISEIALYSSAISNDDEDGVLCGFKSKYSL